MSTSKSDPPGDAARRPTRDRLVTAAMEQFRLGGYHGTGIKAILGAAEAPYGSLYHFFPGGKAELGSVAVATSGVAYRELVELYFPDGTDPIVATRAFFTDAAEVMATSGWLDGCPLARVALETADESEAMRAASLAAFESWLAVLERRLGELGVGVDQARATAINLFCLFEGAFLFTRVARSREAFAAAAEGAVAVVEGALSTRPNRGSNPDARPKKITSSI
jgi:TetR/AcrR family transcriptional regulator, lmrAB and yxaGH operons repressor